MADVQKVSQEGVDVLTSRTGTQKVSQEGVEVLSERSGDMMVSQLGLELLYSDSAMSMFDVFDTPAYVDTASLVDTSGTEATSSEPMIWSTDLRKRGNTRTEHSPCGHWHKVRPAPTYNPGPYQGRWIYPTVQWNTPYMYAYELDPHNTTLSTHLFGRDYVVKVDLSQSPPVMVDRLKLRCTYTGSFDPWRLDPAGKGPFCIAKDGTRLFYMLRHYIYHWYSGASDTTHTELVEVDITGSSMKVVRISMLSDFFSSTGDYIVDGCANSLYSFWVTASNKLIKIANGTHQIVSVTALPYSPSTIDIDREWNRLYIGVYNDYHSTTHYRMNEALAVDGIFPFKSVKYLREVDDWLYLACDQFSLLQHSPHHIVGKDWYNLNTNYYHGGTVSDYIQQVFQSRALYEDGDYRESEVYALIMVNNVSGSNILCCLDTIRAKTSVGAVYADTNHMNLLGSKDISYWAGHGYGVAFDWEWSSMAVMAYTNLVIAHLRYKERSSETGTTGLYLNWLACFGADPTFPALSDSAIANCNWHY